MKKVPRLAVLAALLLTFGSLAACRPHAGHAPRHGQHHHGSGDKHRFNDAEKWAKRFESPTRDAWQKPKVVLAALALKPHHQVVDIGSATGYFTVRIARAVPQGKVWGIDVAASMVQYLNKRARREKLGNLVSRLGTGDSPRLPGKVDRVFICNTYHHLARRVAYFTALRAQLKLGARLIIVDFKAGKHPVGPPPRHRVLPPRLDAELTKAGFKRVSLDKTSLPYQYIAVYEVR